MHINYLSRGCYYFFRDAIARYDDEALQLLRNFRHHENSDTLVASLTDSFDRREASARRGNQSRSPVRTTNANVQSQDRIRNSMQRERGGGDEYAMDFNNTGGNMGKSQSNGGFS